MRAHDQQSMPSLKEALRRYWKNLIGVAVLPPTLLIGSNFFGLSLLVVAPFFILAGGLAGWPYFTHRAPYTFWIAACGIWMLGGLIAIFLLRVILPA